MGLDIAPCLISYSDIYFTEDKARLKAGIRSLFGALVRSRFHLSDLSRLDSWFAETRHGSGASWNLGVIRLDLAASGVESFAWISLELRHISPSVTGLVIHAAPSESFLDRFAKLTSVEASEGPTAHRVYHRSMRWSVWWHPSRETRRREIEELFLSANQEIVRLLRRHIGTGLAMRGPLPSIECLVTPSEIGGDGGTSFWPSLELEPSDVGVFTATGVAVHTAPSLGRTRENLYPRYRVLVVQDQFADDQAVEMYNGEKHAARALLCDLTAPLAALSGLLHVMRTLRKDVADLGDELSEGLVRPDRASRQWLLARPFKRGLDLERLAFALSRLDADETSSHLTRSARGALDHLTPGSRFETSANVAEMMVRQFERMFQDVKSRLSVLREHYKGRLDYALQRTNVWLTVVGIVLALVGLLLALPDDVRAALFDKVSGALTSLWEMVC